MNPIENEQVCSACCLAIIDGSGRLANVPALIKKIITTRAWKRRQIRTGEIVELNSLRELITKKPLDGWGEDPDKIEALIRDDVEVLPLWREVMTEKKGKRGKDNNNNIIIKDKPIQGTSREYTLSRLKSQHPKLYEEVKKGKLSANKAAIQAGFRKQLSVLEQLKKLWLKADTDDRKAFAKWLNEVPPR